MYVFVVREVLIRGNEGFSNLSLSSNICYTIYVGHHRLLDNLAGYLAMENLCVWVTPFIILSNAFFDKIRNSRVNISRTITRFEVDLLCSPYVSSKCSIMLKPIASTVLVN